MTRTFSPRDVFRLRALQARGVSFDLEADVLRNRAPLQCALLGLWPLARARVDTLILPPGETSSPGGFLQARHRIGAPELDVTFLAPAPSDSHGAVLSWQRLISETCQRAGEHGVERVFVNVPQDDPVAIQAFRQLGFQPFTADTVFRRVSGAVPSERSGVESPTYVTDPSPAQCSELEAMLVREQPPAVRRALLGGSDWQTAPLGGDLPAGARDAIQLDQHGAVRGGWRLIPGRKGDWLRLAVDRDGDAEPLVGTALRFMVERTEDTADGPPVYSAAMGHETALNIALRQYDFEAVAWRFRMVKHTTVRRVAPRWQERSTSIRVGASRPASPQAGAGATSSHSPRTAYRSRD